MMTEIKEDKFPDGPVIKIEQEGIRVIGKSVTEKLEKKKLSASAITSLAQCPAKWLASSFVIPDLIEQEPDNAARRGSLFHKVMEDFFDLEPEERTKPRMRKMVQETLESDEFNDLATNKDVIQWLRSAVNNYYNMKADVAPEDVVIAEIKTKNGRLSKGLEVFVIGRIGNASRDTLGFVDRLQAAPGSEIGDDGEHLQVIVEDWKSGAKAKVWNPRTKSEDGLPEQRQQIIYSILLEKMGVEVVSARLIYPVAREVVDVDLTDDKLRARVIADIEKTDKQLDLHIENNLFEFKPSFLCNWCELSAVCPVALGPRNVQKAIDARAQAPTAETLKKGIQLYSRF